MSKTRGPRRLLLLQIHRLMVFSDTFDLYLSGRVSAEVVTRRAQLMLEVGLPGTRQKRRRKVASRG